MLLSTLKPNPKNPRTITEKAFAKLKASIKRDPEFMVLRPIVVDADGVILGGNQRYRACLALGMTEVPDAWVVKAGDLTAAQRKRFVLMDNAPDGAAGEWDWDMLAADWDVPELTDLGFYMPDVGDVVLPGTNPAKEPTLDSEHMIEIHCTAEVLKTMLPTLQTWQEMDGCTVNIS